MDHLEFIGRVSPPAANLTIKIDYNVNWRIEALGLSADYSVSIEDSVIRISAETPNWKPSDGVHYYIRAIDLARAVVDMVAFASGRGLQVHLDYLEVNGVRTDLDIGDLGLIPLCTAYNLSDLSKILPLLMANPAIYMALNDLIVANTLPHQGVVNCARAIDGLRHLIAGPGVR